jgi:hypothetical protein
MLKMVRLLTAVALAVSAVACGGVDSPSSQTASDFSGTLAPADTQFTSFSVDRTGEMQVTLQSLTPRPVIGFLALWVGQQSGATCLPTFTFYIVSQAAIGQQYSFPQITKGTYCLAISDSNLALTQAAAFTVHYTHP